jgi:hypothetical protein
LFEAASIPVLFTRPVVPFTIADAFIVTWALPASSSFFAPRARLRWLADCAAICFPLDYYLSSSLHIPPKITNSIIAALLSFVQTWHINRTTGLTNLSVADFFKTSAAVFAVHLLARYVQGSLFEMFPRIAAMCLMSVVSVGCTAVIQNLAEEGLDELLLKAADEALFFDAEAVPPGSLPFSLNTPDPLQCTICHELVSDPEMTLGFVFCGECLRTWFQASTRMTHPITGEILSDDDIWKSGAHRRLARNFFEAVSQEPGIKT